ncbi:7TM domain-containing protein [Tenacibaculum amylolyticum]|uniref:7TM domain-containing protein n=1 Tax=Tenacibaculum amylolyticum TaxID=104269 RepID=UPI0038934853
MNKSFNLTIKVLIALAFISMSFKIKPIKESFENFLPSKVYKVHYNFYTKANDKKIFVKTYLPISNERQRIVAKKEQSNKMTFKIKKEEENIRGIWRAKSGSKFYTINYSFVFKGKAAQYKIADNLPIQTSEHFKDDTYVRAEEHIQVDHYKIDSLANSLTKGTKDLKSLIRKLYDYVYQIPSAPIRDLTSALKAFEQNQASCNGKARLFVALCRNRGVPARLKGGLILEQTKKRTSHLWSEVYIQGKWIPFDVLNNHFAYLPAYYLEIYTGDHFLITHTPNILFDYNYEIKKGNNVPFINATSDGGLLEHPISFIGLSKSNLISQNILNFLILLPLGGLLVALLKNVIGLKIYGIFLPILMAFTFTTTGLVTGLLLFFIITIVVMLISIPLHTWGLLHTPKMVVVLSASVILILLLLSIGLHYKIQWLQSLSFFPIIVTSITAERFTRAIEEDGYNNAIKKMLQTLVVILLCYVVFSSATIKIVFLVFPELFLIIIAMSMLLGKWIGLRLFEYQRFNAILN